MSDTLAQWFAMSALIRQDPDIEVIGERFGAEGPFTFIGLLCEAALQRRGGRVEGSLRDLAHDCFIDGGREKASEILTAIGETDVIEIDALDSRSFVVQITKWHRWQERFRKAKSRADTTGHERTPPDTSGSEGTDPDAPVARTRTGTSTDTETKTDSDRAAVPTQLQPYMAMLATVIDRKGAKPLNTTAAVKACKDFGDRDLTLEADKFLHYWLDGAGENRKVKDIVGAWRNWLRNAPASKVKQQPPAPVIDLAAARSGLPALEKAWREALPRLKGSLSDSTFDRWIGPLAPVGVVDGDTAVFGAPSGIRSWVEDKYSGLIREALGGTYAALTFSELGSPAAVA